MKVECGNANPSGNVYLTSKGGCRKELRVEDAYRCTGCDVFFHKDCILKHFELEKKHDWGREEERKRIKEEAMKIKYARHNPDSTCNCEDCRVANTIIGLIEDK